MKAIVFTKYGSPDVLQLKEVDKPVPKENEVLVKVHAASINSWDWELLRGTPFINRLVFGILRPKKINILGCDIAGRVEAVGKRVKQFQAGDEVFGDLSAAAWGGFAEYLCAPEHVLTIKPASMSYEQAASIPQAALLALQSLVDKGHVCHGQKVLINGAGGGAGTFAIQIAKSYGAEVTAVDSTGKLEMMRSLGADHVIDYPQENYTKNGQTYDLIIDFSAYHSFFDYKRALKATGTFLMVGGSSGLANKCLFLGAFVSMTSSKKMGLLLHKSNKGLVQLIELVESGKVKPVIDRCYTLSETADAFRYFATGNVQGKIVITVDECP
jgi:NADPH:quinone reductase-like Zn-dependent oxidoreductase